MCHYTGIVDVFFLIIKGEIAVKKKFCQKITQTTTKLRLKYPCMISVYV